ncbi:Gfo/Idh/MocA family protein [Bacillus testis]|uniref:Gfo/Idh/MocA family protein n=1 Tax=Bacillus testis TaxID=1622072 RepID=UPI00067EC5FB|nr:Gfo/Idh/MocA family oxidoreductase [Bacillus testis]
MVKVGIISFAHMHAYSYASCLLSMQEVEIAGIYDRNEERGREAARQYSTSYFHDLDAFLQQSFEAVIICSENAFHKEYVIQAAKAGKHILCEKPLSTNAADAKEMIQQCEEHNVLLQTAFPVRFSHSIHMLKRQIDQGELGDILAIRAVNRGQNPGGWFIEEELSGGGAVLDHTVHMVDIMRWYLNKEIKEVSALVGYQYFSDEKMDDAGLLMIEFENGVIASLDTSWSRFSGYPSWGDAAIEVIGTKKSVKASAFGSSIQVFKELNGKTLQYEYTGNNIDSALVQDFIKSIAEKKSEPSITGYDGLKAMEAALAAYQSGKTLKPVSLSQSN